MQDTFDGKKLASKIHLLDVHTANQIAAGEVIERPASVIKELVENSIDAGATRIKVRIFDSNLEKMQITDNGCGMIPEDLVQAVKRHATSKIRHIDDLNTLATMGFRGEALPAIASVSQMTIISHAVGENMAYIIDIKDGKPSLPEEIGAPPGTTVLVDKLFYNTPARKKFLKSHSWEMGKISDLISRLSISYPHISFSLEHGNKSIIRTSGNGDINQAVLAVYGKEVLDHLVELQWVQNMVVHGLVSLPHISRSSRHHYSFFVNNRWVKSKELSMAVDEAYHTILPAKRYPIVIIYLQIAPRHVDVNVHPAKMEVKFKDPQMVQNIVKDAIKQALIKKEKALPHLSQIHYPSDSIVISNSGIRVEEKERAEKGNLQKSLSKQSLSKSGAPYHGRQAMGKLKGALFSSHSLESFYQASSVAQEKPLTTENDSAQESLTENTKEEIRNKDFIFSSLRPLGQVDGTYIVATADDSIYFIDQHAAHERILYEEFKAKAAAGPTTINQLALPLTLELTHQEALWLMDCIVSLTDMGFIIEHFGDNTFIVRGVPFWYQGSDATALLRAVLEIQGSQQEHLREDELFLLACRSAVKANQYLTPGDITSLLQSLDKCANPNTCPHGRPVIIKISLDEIRRTFLRNHI
ncbi:MAG: DNA mismatch repair endonuclease MutL [Bacillota bacterium]|jgi:DNA mismatch repair protein MutL